MSAGTPREEPPTAGSFAELVDRATRLAQYPPRRTDPATPDPAGPGPATPGAGPAVLGIAGPPGAGKTTLALAVVAAVRTRLGAGSARHVPMDGFHLADVELDRLGRRDRKGAPDTFDPAGYAALLARIRAGGPDTVYAPAFDREIEQPVAGAVPVAPGTRLVVTEGLYLLGDGPWAAARAVLDDAWYVELAGPGRTERLVHRHQVFGKDRDAAVAWVARVDGTNAARVEGHRSTADLVVPGDLVLDVGPDEPAG